MYYVDIHLLKMFSKIVVSLSVQRVILQVRCIIIKEKTLYTLVKMFIVRKNLLLLSCRQLSFSYMNRKVNILL